MLKRRAPECLDLNSYKKYITWFHYHMFNRSIGDFNVSGSSLANIRIKAQRMKQIFLRRFYQLLPEKNCQCYIGCLHTGMCFQKPESVERPLGV